MVMSEIGRYFHEVKDGMFYSMRRSQGEENISSFTL